jgi:hypothetical protein
MDWNISKLTTLRQCHRKFYFAYELANFNFKHPLRRKAFELGQCKTLEMWQGTLIDEFFTKTILPIYQKKKVPNFEVLAEQIVEIAKSQYRFSSNKYYKEQDVSKSVAGNDYLILNNHEQGLVYSDQEISTLYENIKNIILRIPDYPSPEKGKTLHEYLASSTGLLANIRKWSYQFGEVRIKPQIDLVRYKGKIKHVIDWKVSNSNVSDYSDQLHLAGIIAFHNIKNNHLSKGWDIPEMSEVSLFEINLMNGEIKEHLFTKETTALALNKVFMHKDAQEELSQSKDWTELSIEDYETTDKKETCNFCKYKPLCIHLIKNNYQYDEQKYYKLVQDNQLVGV